MATIFKYHDFGNFQIRIQYKKLSLPGHPERLG